MTIRTWREFDTPQDEWMYKDVRFHIISNTRYAKPKHATFWFSQNFAVVWSKISCKHIIPRRVLVQEINAIDALRWIWSMKYHIRISDIFCGLFHTFACCKYYRPSFSYDKETFDQLFSVTNVDKNELMCRGNWEFLDWKGDSTARRNTPFYSFIDERK